MVLDHSQSAMASDDLCLLDLVDVGRQIQTGRLTSVEVREAVLDRIGRYDGHLKSYATLTADLALDEAKQADSEIARGQHRSRLHGVPTGVKDLCHTKGIPTAAGMAIYRDYRPEKDATRNRGWPLLRCAWHRYARVESASPPL